MKVLSVVGDRQQLLKALPISRVLESDHEEVFVYTGERYDYKLGSVFFDDHATLEPDVTISAEPQSQAKQTAAMLSRLDEVMAEYVPDVVLVYGDTNAALAGALVGAKRNAVVAHVEAGLRSGSRGKPEEINRVLADHCSGLLFVPSERTKHLLTDEGITDGVYNTGDVMYDTMLAVRERARSQSPIIDEIGYEPGEFILGALHRTSTINDTDRLRRIIEGFESSSKPVVLPSTPRLKDALDRNEVQGMLPESVDCIRQVGYLEYVQLITSADRVTTDSDRVQKEAFYLDTPCVTLREKTAWLETVTCGWNVLVGTDTEAIARNLERAFDISEKPHPYGDGNTADRIVTTLESRISSPQSSDALNEITP